MARTPAEKLQIKPDNAVYIAGGEDLKKLVEPFPDGCTTANKAKDAEVAVLFSKDEADLKGKLKELPNLKDARAVWVAYQKGGRSDINRDSIWSKAEEVGWTISANVAIDDSWSAVRVKVDA